MHPSKAGILDVVVYGCLLYFCVLAIFTLLF